MKSRLIIRLVLIAAFLCLFTLVTGCTFGQDLDSRLKTVTKQHRFDFVRWEINTIGGELAKVFNGGPDISGEDTSTVLEYFANVAEIKRLEAEIRALQSGNRQGDLTSLNDKINRLRQRNGEIVESVEKILEGQIREALSEQGIYNPIERYTGIKTGFPPVNFILDRPPHLLVVSPRDRIESIREVALLPEMTQDEMEIIESETDELGFSSLVVNLGGIATYPNFVTETGDLTFVLNTVSEEWLHQYLAFTPLGFRYILDLAGLKRDYEIASINEAVAGIVSKEIGAIVYDKYYASETNNGEMEVPENGFDFNKEMREIRKAVDDYLARGEIVQAEEFMEQKRRFLAEYGYHIRKLNQAYFAFHGTYAAAPTSISPIGDELRTLRSRSVSLKVFLDTVAVMTSRQDLVESVN